MSLREEYKEWKSLVAQLHRCLDHWVKTWDPNFKPTSLLDIIDRLEHTARKVNIRNAVNFTYDSGGDKDPPVAAR